MHHLSRPYRISHPALALAGLAAAACLLLAPRAARAQVQDLAPFFEDTSPLLVGASAPGYLGVDVSDVDAEKAQALRLKDVRGAVITLIDHDAPAGQIGLKVNDVVLGINGQNVDDADQLRRMLREIPPGRKISLEISRDGNIQTLAVQLVDRKAMEHDIWNRIGVDVDGIEPISPLPAMGILDGDAPMPGGFHMFIFTSTLKVGALVEPLTSQMSEYLDVPGGLMVKQVARKSEAAAAGLKAFDVILKVGSDSITTSADWERALRSNEGKPVQVTILRDRKEQTLTLQVDSKHHSAVEFEDPFPVDDASLLAEIAPDIDSALMQTLSAQAEAEAGAAEAQARAQAEQIRRQAEKLRENMKNFRVDPQQMDQLRRQMEQFRKSFSDEQMKQLQQQMRQLERRMEEFRQHAGGNFV